MQQSPALDTILHRDAIFVNTVNSTPRDMVDNILICNFNFIERSDVRHHFFCIRIIRNRFAPALTTRI